MKKWAIGCGIVAGLLALAIGLGSCFVIHKAKQWVGGYAQLAEIPAMNAKILKQSVFEPPADGQMEPRQVERYMAVQREMHDRLGERFKQLNDKYSQLSRDLDQKSREANLGESLGAINDLLAVLLEAKRAQIDALNAEGFPLGEYRWIRQQTLITLGRDGIGFNLEAMASHPGNLTTVLAMPAAPDEQAMQRNREILKPHEANLDQWLTLSFFGL